MNRMSKIFLVIIILLVVALSVMIYYYVQRTSALLSSNKQLYLITKAVNDAGFDIETQDEKGTVKLIEKVEE